MLTPQLLILCPLQPRESHIKVGACRGVYQPHMGKLREKKTPTTGPILQTSIKKVKENTYTLLKYNFKGEGVCETKFVDYVEMGTLGGGNKPLTMK